MILRNDFLLYNDKKTVRKDIKKQIKQDYQGFVDTFIDLGKTKGWVFVDIELRRKDIINVLTDLIMNNIYDSRVSYTTAARLMVVFNRELDFIHIDFYACID